MVIPPVIYTIGILYVLKYLLLYNYQIKPEQKF